MTRRDNQGNEHPDWTKHSPMLKKRVLRAVDAGMPKSQIARQFGINRDTVYRWIGQRAEQRKWGKQDSRADRIANWNEDLPPPLFLDELSPEARKAHDDFGYWRLRYLGRRSTPWQVEAANRIVELLASEETEFAVINCPPGSGKTTLFTHDIVLWAITRDRTIRVLLGHSVMRTAQTYSIRIRRALERTRPLPAARDRVAAEGCLAEDYGKFKPRNSEVWRQSEFTVALDIDEDTEESGLEDKEPTVAAYGAGTDFLGARANLVIWDDLVTGDTMHTQQRIEDQRKWWEEEGQTRVEPGGLLLLVGQRMGPDDLYAYSLAQTFEDSDAPRYQHICYPAHDDERCKVDSEKTDNKWHQKTSPAWPTGCLLDPVRLPWHGTNGLATIRANTSNKYEVQYQQRDIDPQNVLVQRAWIEGGKDKDGYMAPGCWDNYRMIGELPKGLSQPWFSTISADPSATNWWAIGWWIYHPASESRFLIDLHHEKMDANDLLDYNPLDNLHYGLLNEWVIRAKRMGFPIQHIIIESNSCQRWILQYEHFRIWQRIHQVQVIAHQTGTNKLDPELGIQSIANRYKFGNIRLPGKGESRNIVDSMVTEATRYEPANPKARPDDTLMMTWFHEFHLPKFTQQLRQPSAPRAPRPTWLAAV